MKIKSKLNNKIRIKMMINNNNKMLNKTILKLTNRINKIHKFIIFLISKTIKLSIELSIEKQKIKNVF